VTSPSAPPRLDADVGPHPTAPPHEWYTSADLLALEQRRLFDRSWALVGTVEQLTGPGSYLTATVGTSPLVVVRDDDGELRAFHNLCRHRGLHLVEGAGECGRFLTCGYHHWSYDLLGALRRVPHAEREFPNMDAADWGLHRASVNTWGGMVFAHPDADAPALSARLGLLTDRLAPFVSGPLVEVACIEYTANCNWKLLVENHIDVYHLWYVHSRSLSMYDHRRFEWDWEADNWWSLEPHKQPSGPDAPLGWLPAAERDGIGAHLLFPNLMIVTTGSYFATYDATPLTPDATRLTLRIRSLAGADVAALTESVRSFMAEDVAVCELLQRGTGSSRFAPGPMAASHEAPIQAFHGALRAHCHE
jgi:phenylpropionate dioxygenase-like ring-hydroxylating dioxygenase large terminal subunit